jgi:hypothetical protein
MDLRVTSYERKNAEGRRSAVTEYRKREVLSLSTGKEKCCH